MNWRIPFHHLRHVRILLVVVVVGFLVTGLAGWVAYSHYARGLPDFQQLANYEPSIVTRVQAGDGRLLAEFAKERRVFVPIKAMPPRVVKAVLAAEDREFYQHSGINLGAIGRAALTNLFRTGSGHRQIGASTITQQVARIFLLGNDYSYVRKIKEVILATRIEQALTKDQILELYLNAPDYGRNAFGIAEAALTYFNKSLDELSVPEAALLAGMLKGPSYYDPIRHPDRAKDRRDYVIDGMAKIGAITRADADAAIAEPIVLHKRTDAETVSAPYPTEEVRRDLIQRFGEETVYQGGLSVRTSIDPALQTIADHALRDGLEAYDRRHGWRGPVSHLTLASDAPWQKPLAGVATPPGAASWRLALVLTDKADGAEIGLADGSRGLIPLSKLAWARAALPDQTVGPPLKTVGDVLKKGDVVLVEPDPAPGEKTAEKLPIFALRQVPAVSGALLALDPHTGRIFAMTGGWSYDMSQFNRATQARRQIGSTIKPFAYLAALENGMTPSTLILGAPVAIDLGDDQPKYRPRNFESEEFSGARTLRWAIEHSVNTMTVRMASTIGIDKIADYVERLGIMDDMPAEYSMVLGAGETTLMRLTTAYAMLVNGGKQISPSVIDRVQDRNGQTVFRHDERACPSCSDPNWPAPGEVPALPDDRAQVLDPGTAYQMVSILQGVVQRGTGAAIGAKLTFPLAGKTGTSNGPNDTWFVGFTPDLTVGIYVGFDDPKTLGPKEQGATVAAPIFQEFMAAAHEGKPAIDFRIPPGIRLVRVDADTGKVAEPGDRRAIWEAFKPGTEPAPEDADQSIIEGGGNVETVHDGDAPVGNAVAGGSSVPSAIGVTQPASVQPTGPSTDERGLY